MLSSCLFLISGWIAISNGHTITGLGMLTTGTTSVLCHGTNSALLRTIDIYTNHTLGLLYSSVALYNGNYIPILSGTVIALFYWLGLTKMSHSLFVHVPVFMNFLHIANYGLY